MGHVPYGIISDPLRFASQKAQLSPAALFPHLSRQCSLLQQRRATGFLELHNYNNFTIM
jgi:hypothetical protein